ncbi:hypothetical protein HMPREF1981_01546 [Bacteroides pyogenes F0041]|uniref:Uncharacterized protein n=1 Tax=Bacteroides pyogenes F0041 TaxID=1321819 RepID=U2CM45_9BACE|nr:hypothetical protein HMPREF1981_01546 [Bacteroides pyogenes F0041]
MNDWYCQTIFNGEKFRKVLAVAGNVFYFCASIEYFLRNYDK